MISGSALGPSYIVFIGMSHSTLRRHRTSRRGHQQSEYDRSRKSYETRHALGEEDRRQPLASFDSRFIGRAPCVEKLHELLARAVIVPFAIAFHDCEQMFERVKPAAFAVERERKIEPGLMVELIGGDLLFKLADRSDRLGLFGEVARGARRRRAGAAF